MNKFIKRLQQRKQHLTSQFSEGGESRNRLLKKAGVLLLVLLILPKVWPIIVTVFGTLFYEEIPPELPEVDVIQIAPDRLDDTITSTGTVKARYEIDLSTEVAGKITELHINEGQLVEQGELLVQINDNDLQADLKRIKANIEVMEQSENRQRQLFERGGATQEEYDATLIQLNNLQAEMAAIEARIERTQVTAPFDGIIGLKYVDEGGYITPSSRIATLRDLSSVFVDFSIPERYSNRVRTGSDVRFTVQGTDSLFVGSVHAVEPGVNPSSRTVNIRAVTHNDDEILRSGAFANIELVLESFEETIMVPSIALMPDMGEYKVMVFEDGLVQERLVQTGIRTENRVQVTGGLMPGETVLINGLLQVRDGMEVSIRNNRDQN